MEKIHWSKLTLVDGDGDKYNTDNNRERFIEAMKEYRQTEEICGFYFSEPLSNQQNIEHCAGWGPQVQEIDWTGIDTKHFKIYYNDRVYAETITFIDKDPATIEAYLNKRVTEYNTNPNPLYHITRANIREV